MIERTKINFGECDEGASFYRPKMWREFQCDGPVSEAECGATVHFGPPFWPDGQLLLDGEPKSVQDEETGIWHVEYPFIFIPGPATDSHSFGGELEYVAFVQASTEEAML